MMMILQAMRLIPMMVTYIAYYLLLILISTENEVDGERFLQLTDEDIGQMVKPVAIKTEQSTPAFSFS